MTTLYIRYPARAAADSGAVQACHYAHAGDGGNVLQQGVSALGNLAELVAAARRVVLLLSAADVTLLQVKVPPLSPARLKAALPALVEDQLLGDPADCVLALAPAKADSEMRTVAVAQRAWVEVLVKSLLAQGAHAISVLPSQLCLPLQPGGASAALAQDDAGVELTLRTEPGQGLGLTLAPQPDAVLHTARALAGDAPLTVYVPDALAPQYEAALQALPAQSLPGLALEPDHWTHWINGAKSAAPDLAVGLATGGPARAWQRWRWPLRVAVAAVVVNIVGLNMEYLRMKREAAEVRKSMEQTFRAAYPRETVVINPMEQMRRNNAAARAGSGDVAPDEFTAAAAAFGEALAGVGKQDVVAGVEYKQRTLVVKLKPNAVDAGTLALVQQALAGRGLALTETGAGIWQIALGRQGGKA